MVPQRSKGYMNFEKYPQISENKLQWHYSICVCSAQMMMLTPMQDDANDDDTQSMIV